MTSKTAAAPKPRDHAADLIRAIAIVLVVTVHVTVPICQDKTNFGSASWWIANFFLAVARIGVPLFFMVSGQFLLNAGREESLPVFFRKRVAKVAIPFVSWALVYLYLKHHLNGESFDLRHVLGEIVQGPVYTHFWFFYALFGLYLATPILRVFLNAAPRAVVLYLLALWAVSESVRPILNQVAGIQPGVTFVVATGYVGYFVGGRVLSEWTAAVRGGTLAALSLLGMAGTALGCYYANRNVAGFSELFSGNRSPNVVLAAGAAFLWIRTWTLAFMANGSLAGRFVSLLSRYSFGIYLTHMLVLRFVRNEWRLVDPAAYPLIGVPACVLLVTGVSFLITALLVRTPFLRATVGE